MLLHRRTKNTTRSKNESNRESKRDIQLKPINIMKAEELRIGNYIKLPTRNLDLVIVEEILKDNFIICDATTNEWPITDYKPIPLTEEWLVKFGFEENTTSWTNWNKPNHTKEVRLTKAYGDVRFHYRVIKHVHQLQNLYFALTNEELTIK